MPSWYPNAHDPINGIFFREQARALRKAGLEVGVVYPDLRSLRSLGIGALREHHFQVTSRDEDGIPTVRWNGWNPARLGIARWLWTRQAARLVALYMRRRGRPDVLHAHGALRAGYAAMVLKRRHRIPYVVTEHSSAYACRALRPAERRDASAAFGEADRVLAVSSSLARLLEREFGSGGWTAAVVPNLVDVGAFRLPEEARSTRPFRFLAVALATRGKGLDVLLRAFSGAFARRADICLEIGGDGPERPALEALARALEIERQVAFLGYLTREQVREAMWRANVFVLPSLYETFGVVLIEAMATGLPVIATRCGGPEDFVTDRVGRLVERGSVEELAFALAEAHATYEHRWAPRAEEIRAHAVTNFREEAVVRRLIGVYHEALSGAGSARGPAAARGGPLPG